MSYYYKDAKEEVEILRAALERLVGKSLHVTTDLSDVPKEVHDHIAVIAAQRLAGIAGITFTKERQLAAAIARVHELTYRLTVKGHSPEPWQLPND